MKIERGRIFFSDKSLFIEEIISSGAEIILLPRPRRFGKTLNLSMVRYFFEYSEGEEREKRERLFQGLAIERSVEFKKHLCKYPFIYITFKDIKERDMDTALAKIKMLISEEVDNHYGEETLQKIRPKQRSDIEKILWEEGDISLYENSLRILSELLAQRYGINPVILIDENDTPVHSARVSGYYREMIDFMRGLLSETFKDNPLLYKGVVTGILRVAKESIFSGLNNLGVYTILDKKFSDKFGFTEEEVESLLFQYGVEDSFNEANHWYKGYNFGGTIIFNPWSIINYADRRVAKHYWANTSSNELIGELIREGSSGLRLFFFIFDYSFYPFFK